jgi:mono/diheme cytochrome c family protein
MKHYLKDLYSILKILVAFTVLIFFSAFYFITEDYKQKQETPTAFWCGVTSGPEDREEAYVPDSSKSDYLLIVQGKELFEGNCTACHAIHKVKVGPALKDISKRRDQKWITSFVRNPMKKIVVEKDPYAVALYNQYNHTEMTAFPSFTEKDVKAILAYINDTCRLR